VPDQLSEEQFPVRRHPFEMGYVIARNTRLQELSQLLYLQPVAEAGRIEDLFAGKRRKEIIVEISLILVISAVSKKSASKGFHCNVGAEARFWNKAIFEAFQRTVQFPHSSPGCYRLNGALDNIL
jgi:hypothetical protein